MLGKLTAKYKKAAEGVDRIMGGYIIRTEIDDILEEGVQQGKIEQAKEIAIRLDKKGSEAEDIADIVGFDIETVEAWLTGKEVLHV